MSHNRGLTLVEVLLAVALLTALATAAVSWAVSQRRASAVIEERYERLRQLLACRQVMREDFRLAPLNSENAQPNERGAVVFRTLRHLPDEPPAQRQVTWRYDAERRALVRSTNDENGERIRVAIGDVNAARFIKQERRGLVLEVRPPQGEPISIVVWGGP